MSKTSSKNRNIFAYLAALCSVALIVLPFLPWYNYTNIETGKTSACSVFNMFFDAYAMQTPNGGHLDFLLFMVPVFIALIVVQGMFVVSLFRKGREPIFPGTVALLIAGLFMLIFLFGISILYDAVTLQLYEEAAQDFLGILNYENWTWAPVTWFAIAIVQKVVLFRLADRRPKSKED